MFYSFPVGVSAVSVPEVTEIVTSAINPSTEFMLLFLLATIAGALLAIALLKGGNLW